MNDLDYRLGKKCDKYPGYAGGNRMTEKAPKRISECSNIVNGSLSINFDPNSTTFCPEWVQFQGVDGTKNGTKEGRSNHLSFISVIFQNYGTGNKFSIFFSEMIYLWFVKIHKNTLYL